jgi:macrolide transport system ATP-binding/permease protein
MLFAPLWGVSAAAFLILAGINSQHTGRNTMNLTIQHIAKTYGYHTVLRDISFTLNAGERIGLVGANGVGKSTLLRIITGEVEADSGTIHTRTGARVGYLAQALTAPPRHTLTRLIDDALAHLHALEAEMRRLEQAMSAADPESLSGIMQAYGETAEKFEHYGGYDMAYRVDMVLDGLGIGHIPRERVFESLSGGEKARAGLALLLLQAPDVLLLDEPTNHLDYASLGWLEDYLQTYRGGVLIVSHDRHFLNRAVTAIVEIDEHSRSARRYSGDYDSYSQAKRQERRKWQQDFARQQEEIKALHIEIREVARRNDNYRPPPDGDKFIKFFKSSQHDRTVARRVHSAEEKLKRIQADPVPRPPDDLRFKPDFDPDALRGRTPLFASRLCKTYGERMILDGVTFTLGVESRVVLVGPNGAGKSTLLRILAGHEAPDSGEVMLHPAVRIGYLDQEQHLLDGNQTVLAAYAAGLDGTEQQHKATLLQSGLFRLDDLDKRVRQLSLGQQRKLQIARLIAHKANLLILDEPTNYVSFDVLESLESALADFPGPIIAASHDRRFIQQFGGEIWSLQDGQITIHSGGYAAYCALLMGDRVS